MSYKIVLIFYVILFVTSCLLLYCYGIFRDEGIIPSAPPFYADTGLWVSLLVNSLGIILTSFVLDISNNEIKYIAKVFIVIVLFSMFIMSVFQILYAVSSYRDSTSEITSNMTTIINRNRES